MWSRSEILHGLCKIHKAITDVCPSFRPIVSAFGTPDYKLAKSLVSKLSLIPFYDFITKRFFCFWQINYTSRQ